MTLTFPVVTCSQCGKAFAGPRPCGFSHCQHHKRLRVLTHQEEYAMRQQKPDPRGEGHSMSDQNLRERLMDYGVSGDERDAAGVIDLIVEWLSASGLAIVPVDATDDMHAQWVLQSSWPNSWRALLKAAPPAAVLLKGTQDE